MTNREWAQLAIREMCQKSDVTATLEALFAEHEKQIRENERLGSSTGRAATKF